MRSVGRCTAFRSCRRRVKYGSPSKLCSKHWAMWWDYGVKGREELPYMRPVPTRLVADALLGIEHPTELEYACQLLTDLRGDE